MIAMPLKVTNEIDWISPLKSYIRKSYGDDPERYAEECATLNRLRQDMRGAGKDNAAGRDLLYHYYGQLEFLDLRFPVDENHIRMSFTWCVPRAGPCGFRSRLIAGQVRCIHSQANITAFACLRKGFDHLQLSLIHISEPTRPY